MSRLGRNDPCHCGSGKKYKKCHLDADERSRLMARPKITEPEEAELPADMAGFPGAAGIKKMKEMLGLAKARGLMQNRGDLRELAAEIAPMLEYLDQQDAIEPASAELELHRSEFEEFSADQERMGDFAHTLFGEEPFAPLRFTAADIKRAFDTVGYPATLSLDEKSMETLRKAILLLATPNWRQKAALRLLARVPAFVAARRFNEAWLIQLSAHETMEAADSSNLFLFQMFGFGYDAWAAEKHAHDESLLGELGIDLARLKGMSMEQLDQWIASQNSGPAGDRVLEAFFKAHPELQAESVANLEAMERNSSTLLQRQDCRFLLLSDEELEPWVQRFNDLAIEDPMLAQISRGNLSEADKRRIFDERIRPLMEEMAESIFTPDRIKQLVSQLKQFRSEKLAAGDQDIAMTATGAINYLEREDEPEFNSFLLALCWASILGLGRAPADESVVEQSK
jgi:SEC-C motif